MSNNEKTKKIIKSFDYNSYVNYCENENNSKCLIRNCPTVFKGHSNSTNIARHYDVVHKFIINRIRYIDNENEFLKEILEKYYDFDDSENKAYCKYLDCEKGIGGKDLEKLLRHYRSVHDFNIKNEEHSQLVKKYYEIGRSNIILNLNDIQDYDEENKTYKCLFKNCNVFNAPDLDSIKLHYINKHNIIIREMGIIKKENLFKYEIKNIWQDDNNAEKYINNNIHKETKGPPKVYAKKTDIILTDYVETYPELNIAKCLLDTCRKPLNYINISTIKTHYFNTHFMHILNINNSKTIEECEEILEENYNESYVYPLEAFLSDCKKDELYKCLFKNCLHFMAKELLDIKTHYQQAHNIIVTKTTKAKLNKKCINYDHLYKNLYLQKTSTETLPKKPRNSKYYAPFVFENYVEYSPQINMSKCLINFCKGILSGRVIGNLKRHYLDIHNFQIYQRLNVAPFEEIKQDLSDLEFDKFLHGNCCLFTNCNAVLEENWDIIQRHYYDKHKILIEKTKQKQIAKPKPKRPYNTISQQIDTYNTAHSITSESLNDDETEHQQDDYNSSINNESPDNTTELEDEPKSKRLAYELYETETCFIEIKEETIQEYVVNESDILSTNSYISNETDNYIIETNEKSIDVHIENESDIITTDAHTSQENNQANENITTVDILKPKYKFLKLCLGVIIKHEWPLKLFDDAKYLKPLLAPYEETIESDINSKLISELMVKANDVLIEKLKECFKNKIVCFELYLLKHGMINYVIFNIRYLEKETVQNKIIGFLPITPATTILPITEYLKKFNIDEQQIYMKTISASFQENEEIYKICDNLRKHNPNLINHPIHEIQLILKNFRQDYDEELNLWQTHTKYECKFDFDILHSLKDFSKYVKSLDMHFKPQLKDARQFCKTLQIFWNFYNKIAVEQYVVGDFYRDLLCCEMELQNEFNKFNNKYAGNLCEKLSKFKNSLLETNEFLAGLYLDVRYNFCGTHLLNKEQKLKAMLFLANKWQKFGHFLKSKTEDNIEDILDIWIPNEKESFHIAILDYWRNNHQDHINVKCLMNISYTFPVSQYVLKHLRNNFKVFKRDTGKLNKFIASFNENILHENLELIFKDF